MRIAVLGAGAVGGYYGALLARAGHEVGFVARGQTLDAIRSRGLTVHSGLGNFTASVRAEADPALLGGAELAIVAVKTYSNPEALPLLRPLAGPETSVLTLQNGVDSADEVAAVVGERHVLAGATYIAASLAEPGVVEHVGTARRIVFGEAFGPPGVTPRVAAVAAVLAEAGVQVEAVDDCRVALWEKLIFLAPLAGTTAAARLPVGPCWADPAFREVTARAMAEVEAVARAEGIAVAPDVRDQKLRYLDNSPPTMRTSMMMDVVAGRPTEVEALLGAVVRRGRARGVATPAIETLHGVLRPLAGGRA
ncbi:MAG: 2-dehydropantoate 2-reductase [Acidobacteria bacterium]|nr:MAG: 2-dehydropantoate 2-reductase [Acidobacteriota bacterium]